MKTLLSAVLAALLMSMSFFAVAGEELRGVYLGGAATGYFLDDDRFLPGEDEDDVTLGAQLGYRYDNPLAVEIGFGAGSELDAIKIDGFYYLTRSRGGWAPYFVLGYTHFNFDDDDVLVESDDSTGQMDAGFGVSKTWDDSQWEFRLDGRFLEKFGSGDQATDLALNLAVNYYFAQPEEPAPAPVSEPMPQPEPEPQTRTITVELRVLFEFDKAVVRAIYGDELTAVARAMQTHDDIVLDLEGHTDAVGTDAYNQDLSLRRVEAVKEKLVADYGIAPGRITTVGYGESRPIADNSTDEGRAKNRRVVGQVTFDEMVPE